MNLAVVIVLMVIFTSSLHETILFSSLIFFDYPNDVKKKNRNKSSHNTSHTEIREKERNPWMREDEKERRIPNDFVWNIQYHYH